MAPSGNWFSFWGALSVPGILLIRWVQAVQFCTRYNGLDRRRGWWRWRRRGSIIMILKMSIGSTTFNVKIWCLETSQVIIVLHRLLSNLNSSIYQGGKALKEVNGFLHELHSSVNKIQNLYKQLSYFIINCQSEMTSVVKYWTMLPRDVVKSVCWDAQTTRHSSGQYAPADSAWARGGFRLHLKRSLSTSRMLWHSVQSTFKPCSHSFLLLLISHKLSIWKSV